MTPLWGVHWLIVLAVCVPLRLDAGVAFLASNVSLPFVAPFLTFGEIEVGARVVRGAWLALTVDEARAIAPRAVAAELAAGTAIVAVAAAAIGGALAYAIALAVATVSCRASRRRATDRRASDPPA